LFFGFFILIDPCILDNFLRFAFVSILFRNQQKKLMRNDYFHWFFSTFVIFVSFRVHNFAWTFVNFFSFFYFFFISCAPNPRQNVYNWQWLQLPV